MGEESERATSGRGIGEGGEAKAHEGGGRHTSHMASWARSTSEPHAHEVDRKSRKKRGHRGRKKGRQRGGSKRGRIRRAIIHKTQKHPRRRALNVKPSA